MCMGSCRVYVHGYPQDWLACPCASPWCWVGLFVLYVFWLLIFILLYCSDCVSICVVHYFIAFLIMFMHSITTVTFHYMSKPVTTPYLYSLSVLCSHTLIKVAVYHSISTVFLYIGLFSSISPLKPFFASFHHLCIPTSAATHFSCLVIEAMRTNLITSSLEACSFIHGPNWKMIPSYVAGMRTTERRCTVHALFWNVSNT